MAFTRAELDHLRSPPLGRLATVGDDGVVQANPVGFRVTADGSFLIGTWGVKPGAGGMTRRDT